MGEHEGTGRRIGHGPPADRASGDAPVTGPGADPRLVVEPSWARVEAGGQVQLAITLANPSRYVESYRLHVTGLPDGWWQVHPPEVPVYARSTGNATLVITPPDGVPAPAEPIPLAVCAVSARDGCLRSAEEVDLELGRVFRVQAEISPVTSSARWSARHRLRVGNWGNRPAELILRGSDPEGRLGFLLRPERVVIPVGGTARVSVRVRPGRPTLRGGPVRLPFTVTGEPAEPSPPAAERPGPLAPGVPADAAEPDPAGFAVQAAVLQRPLVPRLATQAVVALGVLLAVLAVLGILSQHVVGARTPDVAPPVPAGVKVAGLNGGKVTVSWTAAPRALSYTVVAVDPERRQPVAGSSQRDVEAPATSVAVDVAGPRTVACFHVRAVRGRLWSAPSEVGCGTSLRDDLPAPQEVTATLTGPGTVTVAWTPRARAPHLVLAEGQEVGQGKAGVRAVKVTVPPGKLCVEVLAVSTDGSSSSAAVRAPCITVTGPTGSPDASGGSAPGGGAAATGSGTDASTASSGAVPSGTVPAPEASGGLRPWVVLVCQGGVVADAGARSLLEPCRKDVVRRGLGEIVVLQVPQPGTPTLGVFVNGFATRPEATAFCDRVGDDLRDCEVWESAVLSVPTPGATR